MVVVARRRKKRVRPEQIPQMRANSKDTATQRRVIAGTNTSSFYSTVYGRINDKDRAQVPPLNRGYRQIVFPWGEVRHIRPDIVHIRRDGVGLTELKAFSTRTSQAHCSIRQFTNYAFALMFMRGEGGDFSRRPWVDYAFVRYGDRNFRGQHKFENGNLIRALSKSTRDMTVVPMSLLLFQLMISPIRTFNQESSGSTLNSMDYWDVRASTINAFREYDPERACQEAVNQGIKALDRKRNDFWGAGWEEPNYKVLQRLRRPGNLRRTIEELSLDALVPEHSMSPRLHTAYGPISPFPILKFKTSEDVYQKFLDKLTFEGERILQRIGVPNLYRKLVRHERRYGREVAFSEFPIPGLDKIPF